MQLAGEEALGKGVTRFHDADGFQVSALSQALSLRFDPVA